MFHVDVSVWMPDPLKIKPVISAPDEQPLGLRFGGKEPYGDGDVVVFLAAASEKHENQFMDTIGRCDAIIESALAVRGYALKRMAELYPNEEIVAVISDVEEAPGWDGAGADVEAQRG